MADPALDLCVAEIKANHGKFYVYVLSRPCGEAFYIGLGSSIKGRRARLLDHEAQATGGKADRKCSIIRKIWRDGLQVLRSIDSWYFTFDAAVAREVYLILSIGRRDLCTGPLANLTDGGEGAVNPSPATRSKISARMRMLNKDAEFAKRRDDRIRAVNNDPVIRERTNAAVRSSNERPENKRRIMGNLQILNTDPDRLAAANLRIRSLNADPQFIEEHRELRRQTMSRLRSDPEFNRKQSEAAKRQHADPAFLEKIRAGKARMLSDPAQVERLRSRGSEIMKALWTNEAFKAECSKRASIRMRQMHASDAEFKERTRKRASEHAKRLQSDPVFMAENTARMVARHSDPIFLAKGKAGRDKYIAEFRGIKMRCQQLSAGKGDLPAPRSKKLTAWRAYEAGLLKASPQ